MDALRKLNTPHWRTRLALVVAAILVLTFAFALEAHAKCSIRVADPLITARYQQCKPREFLSYLYNDLVTPFSFTCAKKISATCEQENCSNPSSEEELHRCLDRYVAVLNECNKQIDDAARMARCKDTKDWPIEAVIASRAPAGTTARPILTPGRPVLVPDVVEVPMPVTVEPLPENYPLVNGSTFQASQSGRRIIRPVIR